MGSKKIGTLLSAIAFVLLLLSGNLLYGSAHTGTSQNAKIVPFAAQSIPGSLSLITEPQDGTSPLQKLIQGASSTIDLVMYEFDDTQLEQLRIKRAQEGIAVRVMLDNGYFGAGSNLNQQAFETLRSGGVQVHWSPTYFALTHEKSIVVDQARALIMTFNLTPKYYKSDRDFALADTDASDVAAMEQAFDSDWNGQKAPAPMGDALVWSPGSHDALLSLINSATSSLDIYNEEMQDSKIIAALEAAAVRGVDVEVVMTYSSEWKSAFQALSRAGVHVRTYKASAPLYIHAKMVLTDGAKAFVGSENFSSTSLDQNRELGIVVSDASVISELQRTFSQDENSAAIFK